MEKYLYIETYGCQMNFSDSEIIASVMREHNYLITDDIKKADLILINTCSIRDHAEQRVLNRLNELSFYKKKNPNITIGLLGCMAERMNNKIFEKTCADIVAGPDTYRSLPQLIQANQKEKRINVLLSDDETYNDIQPIRLKSNGVSAFISIMRGCENFCTYCVVPYTRGKERSRNPYGIINESEKLFKNAYREICLLGQNVNSYHWNDDNHRINFPQLLKKVSEIDSKLRVRFATSHPKDISNELIETIANTPNICKSIHLPIQSGSNNVLKKMNRKYTVEWYMERIEKIKQLIPDCGLSTDVITGFCGETEEDHQNTLKIFKQVKYDFAYMFMYSDRPGTAAHKRFEDDVPEDIKKRRLNEIIQLQQKNSFESNKKDIGKVFEVLVENVSKRSDEHLSGRNSQNKVIVFPKKNYSIGDYVNVKITNFTAATLIGEPV